MASVVIGAVGLLASWMWWRGSATGLEAVSFVTGAIWVVLVIKQSAWNFPIGLANALTYSVVYFRAGLLADSSLQVIYAAMLAVGWWQWRYGGANHTPLSVTRGSRRELIVLAASVPLATFLLSAALERLGGSATFWDALTFSGSLASQWLLNRKRLENWLGWIAVDAVYVPLYIYKSLYLTAVLYAVYLVMAGVGYLTWRRSMSQDSAVGPLLVEAELV